MTSSKKISKKKSNKSDIFFIFAQLDTVFILIAFVFILILFVLFIGYSFYLLIKYIIKKIENYDDYYTCTMTLNDIDPMNVNQYMKYNNKYIPCGDCKGATLKAIVNTCAIGEDGVQSPNCKPNVNVVSSIPKPIDFADSNVAFDKIDSFFCLN